VAILKDTVVRFLVNRLRFETDLKKHPEILQETIQPPLIIMGLPRTGTTKLHRMMAVDQRFQSLRAWQILNPAPFPDPPDKDGRDPRIAYAERVDAMVDALAPGLMAGHPVRATDVDEESVTMMEMNFDYLLLAMRIDAPKFTAWTKTRPITPNYLYLRKWLQYLQWQMGGGGRPYLLKSPLHLSALDSLLEVFPQAIFVHCHRNPAEAVTSFMRLAELSRPLLYDRVDPHDIGNWVLRDLAEQIQLNLEQRTSIGERLPMIDVAFRDIIHDPLGVIETICARRGWNLPSDTKKAMVAFEQSHPPDRFGKFRYTLEPFGKTQKDFDIAFREYYRRFAALI
jgi:hypothetical protein